MSHRADILIYVCAENIEKCTSFLHALDLVLQTDIDLSGMAEGVEYTSGKNILRFSLGNNNFTFSIVKEDEQDKNEENPENPDILLFLEEFEKNCNAIYYRKILKFDPLLIKFPGASADYVFVNFQKNFSDENKLNEALDKITGNKELHKILYYMVRYNFFSDNNCQSVFFPELTLINKYPFWFSNKNFKANRNFLINHYVNVNSISLCLHKKNKYLGYKEVILTMFNRKKEKDKLKDMEPIVKRFAVVGYTGSGKTHLLYDILKSIKAIAEDNSITYLDTEQYKNRGLGGSFISALENQWENGIQKTRSDYIVPENIHRILITGVNSTCWAIEFLDIAGEIFTEKSGDEFIYSIIQNKFDQILNNIKTKYKLNSEKVQLWEEILNFNETNIIQDKQNKTLNPDWVECFKIIDGPITKGNENQKNASVADIVDKASRSFIGFLFIKSCEEIYCCVEPDIDSEGQTDGTENVAPKQSAAALITALSNKLTAIVINKIDMVLDIENAQFVSVQKAYAGALKNNLLSDHYIKFYMGVTNLANSEYQRYRRHYYNIKLYHSSSAFNYNMEYYKPYGRQFFREGKKLNPIDKGRFSSDIFTLKMLTSFEIITSRDLYNNTLNKIMKDEN